MVLATSGTRSAVRGRFLEHMLLEACTTYHEHLDGHLQWWPTWRSLNYRASYVSGLGFVRFAERFASARWLMGGRWAVNGRSMGG